MYETTTRLHRQLRVQYPISDAQILLRTELDWDRDIAPTRVSDAGETFTFELEARRARPSSSGGYRPRHDFLRLTFPLDVHDEQAWGRRLHLPLQIALGKVSTAARGRPV